MIIARQMQTTKLQFQPFKPMINKQLIYSVKAKFTVTAKVIKNMPLLKAVTILNRVQLFNLLTIAEKQHIAESHSLFYHIPDEEEFITLGEMDDGFYVLLSGTALVIHSGEELTEVSAGDFVGETGFMGNNRRSASVVAQTDIIALKFNRKTFQILPMRVREIIKDHIIQGLVERVEELNVKVVKEIKANKVLREGEEDLFE